MKPPIAAEEVVAYAREFFGLGGSATLLPSEADGNFKLHVDDGRAFVVKISDITSGPQLIEAQNETLDFLGRGFPHLRIPRVMAASTGQKWVPISRDGCACGLRILSYVEGIPLADYRPHSGPLLEAIGGFLGSIDRALVEFDHPGVHRTFPWDLRAAKKTFQECIADVRDSGRRRLLESLFDKSWGRLSPGGDDLRKSVIHGDANDYNLLVRGALVRDAGVESPPDWSELLGLVDFGDLVYSWTIAELAIACAYMLADTADPLTALRWAVRGYHRELPITEVEMSLLYDLIMLRLLVSVSIGSRNARLRPEDEYLQISQPSSWALLEKLGEIQASLFHSSVRAGCGLESCPEEHRGPVIPVAEQSLPGAPVSAPDSGFSGSGATETAAPGKQEAIESLRRSAEAADET